jgi:hypothetical protein
VLLTLNQAVFDLWELFWESAQDQLECFDCLIHQMNLTTLIKLTQILQQRPGNLLQLQRNKTQTPHRLPTNLCLTMSRIIIELVQQIAQVILTGQGSQNLQLDMLDVGWLVDLEVEVLEVGFEDLFGFQDLDDVADVLEDHVGGLGGAGHLAGAHQGQQRRFYALDYLLEDLLL